MILLIVFSVQRAGHQAAEKNNRIIKYRPVNFSTCFRQPLALAALVHWMVRGSNHRSKSINWTIKIEKDFR